MALVLKKKYGNTGHVSYEDKGKGLVCNLEAHWTGKKKTYCAYGWKGKTAVSATCGHKTKTAAKAAFLKKAK